jgi:3-hydroxyisobutyrate dehydrogenase-like beta-hydroxyacid dehydrogenase
VWQRDGMADERIGFIGLGAMGAPMARRLVDAGYKVTVWNRTRSRGEPLAAAGARVAATPAEVGRAADVTITMVSDATALEAVAGDVLDGGSVLVDMSTVGPQAIVALAERVRPDGGLLDAPVLGSVPQATEGTLRIFVGGDAGLVRRVEPVLAVLGEPVHVGPLGSGAAAKLVANSTLFGVLAVLGEAIALGEGLGLPRDTVFDVLATTPLADQAERRRGAIEDGSYPTRFSLSLALKDADLVLGGTGHDLRAAAAARSWLADADEAGLGALDYTAVLRHIVDG